jgi:hypothetical protein
MRRRPAAVREAIWIFFWAAGSLNHAVQRDVFHNPDLSHSVSLKTVLKVAQTSICDLI